MLVFRGNYFQQLGSDVGAIAKSIREKEPLLRGESVSWVGSNGMTLGPFLKSLICESCPVSVSNVLRQSEFTVYLGVVDRYVVGVLIDGA